MSEKVLGFYKKDGVITSLDDSYKVGIFFEKDKAKEVSVRLASESVGLKWLKEEIESFYRSNPEMEGANMALKHLFSMAEKEAKK